MRRINLATAVITLVVVAGPPLLAVCWLLRHPWRAPTRGQVLAWSDQPLTAGTIVAGCVTIVVLLWLLLIVHLARQGFAGLRRRARRLRHLPVPTPVQMTATSMAGLAAFTTPTVPAGHVPAPPAAGTLQAGDPAGSGHEPVLAAAEREAGIALPGGGWIPYRTAAAITALAAARWLHRRRHYRPDPAHPRNHDDDPDLQPDPDAVHTAVAAVTDISPAGPHPAAALPVERLPDGILQLTGPGAAAAARGILVTAAVSPESRLSVRPVDLPAARAATATAPTAADPASTTPTLTRRHGPHRGDAEGTRRPPSDPGTPRRAGTIVVLGDDPAVTHRWHVAADGTATGTGLHHPRRLCVLDPQAATDLLALLDPGRAPRPWEPPPGAGARRPRGSAEGPAATAVAELTLLGACRLTVAAEPVHLHRSAALQILAYLAVHPDGATARQLTHALWPHLPPATIIKRLHTTLTDLRTQLRPLLGGEPVTRQDDRYRLNAGVVTSDLQAWRTRREILDHTVGAGARQRAYRDLVDAYRGELAADRAWPWLTAPREQIRRSVIDACAALAAQSEPAAAITWLQRAISIDPHNEAVHHQAAALLEASGDHPAAAELMKTFHERLGGSGRRSSGSAAKPTDIGTRLTRQPPDAAADA